MLVAHVGLLGDELAGGLGLQHHAGQRWPQAVMEVPAEPATLLLTCCHESFPGVLELLGEMEGVYGGAGLSSEVVQQRAISRIERLRRRTGRHAQLADRLVPVHQRHDDGVGHRDAPVGRDLQDAVALQGDGDIRRLECSTHAVHDRSQHSGGGDGRLQPLAEG